MHYKYNSFKVFVLLFINSMEWLYYALIQQPIVSFKSVWVRHRK